MTGKCRLCLKKVELIKSHIIPEYFYRSMYDSKHRFMQISPDPNEVTSYLQKGIREFLLCEKCEQQFSRYERYINQVYYYKSTSNVNQDDKFFVVENANYSSLKLFQLSVLWRAAVSSLKDFDEVELGPHQEFIRQMLLDENPGRYYEYGCLQVAVLTDESKVMDGLIMPPVCIRLHGFRYYRFTFGGIIWIYVVSNHNYQFRWKELFLSEEGKVTIQKRNVRDIKYIMDFGSQVKGKGIK